MTEWLPVTRLVLRFISIIRYQNNRVNAISRQA